MMALKKFSVGFQLHKEPAIRYGYATHRVIGRTKPGEVRRRTRIAGKRKETRADVQQLCKYMIFKGGKFMPGKMV